MIAFSSAFGAGAKLEFWLIFVLECEQHHHGGAIGNIWAPGLDTQNFCVTKSCPILKFVLGLGSLVVFFGSVFFKTILLSEDTYKEGGKGRVVKEALPWVCSTCDPAASA